MATGRALAAAGLGVIAAMALVLLITRNASLDLAVSEFPAPEPTPTPVLTPIPAGTAAFRFAQRYDTRTDPIGAGYQAATNTERFQASEFSYVTAPLHAGNLVVPLCLLVDGHPWVRYAVAAPASVTPVEFRVEGANRIGGFTLQDDQLAIGGNDYNLYVSTSNLDCGLFEERTLTVR